MSLLAPLYLLGLLGLLLPWLLHRFSHHEPPEQAFPSTRFLQPSKPPATSKRKLRYWMLLALRVLFLIALCLLFAQPGIHHTDNAQESEAVQLVVIDNSFSMRAAQRWQRAQEAVRETVAQLPEQDAVQLFSYAAQLRALTELTTDRALASRAVNQIEPSYESADYGELMRRLNKVAGDSKKPVSATFITDAQRTNLPSQMNTLLANRLHSFTVVSIAGATPINYALQASAKTNDAVTARVSVQVAASGVSASSANAAAVSKTVQVSMQDRVLASQVVTLAPGEVKTIVFDAVNLPSESQGLMQVAFANTDFLSEDDKLKIPVRSSNLITLALSSMGVQADAQARVFVSTSLETNEDAKVETMSPDAALAPGIRHAVVFVESLDLVPERVNRFVMDGGNVLLIPTASTTAIAPASLSDASSFTADTITRIDLAHPLALGDIDWFTPKFYANPTLKPTNNDSVLLGLESGTPLLVERSAGDQGRLLLLNDVLDGFDSDLPLQPAFVLLMQHIVAYFNASNALPVTLNVGSELLLPANNQLLAPDGEPLLAITELGGRNSARIEQPGVYTVLGSASSHNVTALLDRRESNLLEMAPDEITAWESRHEIVEGSQHATDTKAQGQPTGDNILRDTQKLMRWLLPIALLLLVLESLYANRLLWVRRDGL